ncbi:HAMP domain-containing sensor histidine kinase [soil metagenome]
MKLLTYTSRIQLFYFLILFGFFSILFYLVLSWNVQQNVDEVLYNRKENLMAFLEQNPEAPFQEDNPLDDFTFYQIDESAFQKGKESYKDTLVYEQVDDELDEYRKMTTFVNLEGRYYKLEIVKPHLEATEMISTIAITLVGLFLGLALSLYLSQRIIFKNIWNPFYEMLEQLRHFRLDKRQLPEFSNSQIDEFQMLNEAVNELARKNMEVFESQKQFIENASHEMQTPLSIIQSRLEALIGQAELTEEQADIVEGIISSTQRLKKLNKTLLLLSKIENQEFLLTEKINIKTIIIKSLEYYDEQKEMLNIQVRSNLQPLNTIKGNEMLTEILIQNLLKNAFLHNVKDGWITITTQTDQLTITNSGNFLNVNHDRIFDRFFKQSNNSESWGLGLSIASKITKLSNWELTYRSHGGEHRFTVYF